MKGVMMPGVSAGSNQVGASETWTAQVIWPLGPAGAAGAAEARATAAAMINAHARKRVMVCPPLHCDKDRARSRGARLPDYPRIPCPVNRRAEGRGAAIAARKALCYRPPDMGVILDLAESFWQGQIPPRDMWRPTGKSEELAPGVVFFHTWANVTAIRTEAGLGLVDTGNYTARAQTLAPLRALGNHPLPAPLF